MSSALVGILDLNSGNLRSVSNAIYESGFEFSLIRESAQLDNVTHLIIPGVGAFSTAIENILSADLFDALDLLQPKIKTQQQKQQAPG